MLIVRLKQCECAIDDNRLDAAYELLRADDLRGDRRGQALIGRLAREFVARARNHLDEQRLGEASADCEKAMALAGNLPEVSSLRLAISEAASARQNLDRARGQLLSAARKHLDAGQLTIGGGLLSAAETADARAEALKQELADRRATLQSVLTKASAAFDAGNWENAIEHLAALGSQYHADAQVHQLVRKIMDQVTTEIQGAIESGRLDRAASLLSRVDRLAHHVVDLDHVRATLNQCRLAFEMASSIDAQKSLETLRRLLTLWPKARWMESAVDHFEKLSDALEQLRSGPLGLATMGPQVPDLNETRAPAPTMGAAGGNGAATPKAPRAATNLFLHADGIGGFQVVSGSAISIGAAGASIHPDIALLAGAGVPSITLSRSDGDYFLRSREPVLINDKPSTGKLLVNGDKIALGPRCRLTFRRPAPASGTAMLDLSGARLARGDIRQVILLDREIVMGPGPTAHVRCDELSAPVVLQPGNDRFLLRAADAVQVNGQAMGKPAEVAIGSHVRVGPLSFMLARE